MKGRTAANESVTAALTEDANIREMRQTTSNTNGTYSICLHNQKTDTWENCILRVGFGGDEDTRSYTVPVPKLTVAKGDGEPVHSLAKLSDGESVTAVLSNVVRKENTAAMLVIATYDKSGKLINVKMNDFTLDEPETSATAIIGTVNDIGKIKALAWQTDTLYPVASVYTIE